MNRNIRRRLDREKRKIITRLEPLIGGTEPLQDGEPELRARAIVYEFAQRTRAIPCGGVGAIMRLVDSVGLVPVVNERARVLKVARPYQDSDHVLNIALNLICGGEVLDDIEIRRNDAAFLDALGARAVPDPTTAGDYSRRGRWVGVDVSECSSHDTNHGVFMSGRRVGRWPDLLRHHIRPYHRFSTEHRQLPVQLCHRRVR